MGYGDNRYGGDNKSGRGDRWQGGDQGGRWEREHSSYGDWGSEREHGGQSRGGDQDRGFFERAADQARSWFNDDDDRGGRSPEQQQGRGQQRYEDSGGAAGGRSSYGGGGGGAEPWGGSGFGGPVDNGRRFDRIDAGHVGSQGAHPMSSPVDAGYGAGAGISPGGAAGSSAARYAALGGGGQQRHLDTAKLLGDDRGGGGQQQQGRGMSGGHQDPHYSEWRQRQIEQLDRDYHEYRQEHQSKFEQEFGGWRQKRQTQRQHMGRAREQMEVIGSDGEHIGTVDKVSGERIILTKSDANAGGIHHSIPCSWIESVDERVTVNKTAQEAMQAWQNEDQNRALFERGDEGSDGPHILNRSFSNTYSDRDE